MLMTLLLHHLVEILYYMKEETLAFEVKPDLDLVMRSFSARGNAYAKVRKVLTEALSPLVEVRQLLLLKVHQKYRILSVVPKDALPLILERLLSGFAYQHMLSLNEFSALLI